MTSENFFDKMDYNRNMKYDANAVMKMMEAYALQKTDELINKPQFGDFVESLKIEMAHHEQRWGDESKTDPHHFQMVMTMIAGKLATAIWQKDKEKFEHHLITIAAVAGSAHKYFKQEDSVCENWFN